MPGRSADARTHVEHPGISGYSQSSDPLIDRGGAEIMILVERRQLLDIDGIILADTERSQLVEHALNLVIQLHGLDIVAAHGVPS